MGWDLWTDFWISEHTDEVVKKTSELRGKITATIEKSMRADECRIMVLTFGGQMKKHVEHSVGSFAVPMTDEQLQKNLEDQCAPVAGECRASKLFSSFMAS
jgi:hypothetical protein